MNATEWRKANGLEHTPTAYRYLLNGRLAGETETRNFAYSDDLEELKRQGRNAGAVSSIWIVDTNDDTIIWRTPYRGGR